MPVEAESPKRPVSFWKETRRATYDKQGNKHMVGTGRYRYTARCPDKDHDGEATVALEGQNEHGLIMRCARDELTFVAALPEAAPPPLAAQGEGDRG